tara:strand:+ start:67 stop:303 length:237 start_codon:yes stop_codon:yes gene_type:complete
VKDKSDRWPEVGDLLIHTYSGKHCQGLITEVASGKGFGSARVFVKWAANNAPYDYFDTHGYSAVNIHNSFNSFKLVKA